MRPTMGMVLDGLRRKVPCEKGCSFDPSVPVSFSCELRPANVSRRRGWAFVCDDLLLSDLASSGESPDHVPPEQIIGISRPGQRDSSPCSILVTGDFPVSHIVDKAEEVICAYKTVIEEMSALAMGNSKLGDLVDCAYRVIGNPILVQDCALRVRACTTYDAMDDELWVPLDSRRAEFAGRAKVRGFDELKGLLQDRGEVLDHRMYNGVHHASRKTNEKGDDFLLVHIVQKNRPITEGDADMLRFLCSMIELRRKASQEADAKSIGFSGLMTDALEGRVGDHVEFENRIRALGLKTYPYVVAVLVKPRKGRLIDGQAIRILRNLERAFPYGRGFPYESALLVFFGHDAGKAPTKAEYKRLESFLSHSGLVGSVSETRLAGASVREMYESCLFTLEAGRRVSPDRFLHRFEDCRPYWPYEACLKDGCAALYRHDALDVLARHDSSSEEGLLQVLKCFAENGGNKTRTARALFMQRGTLQARLNEIEGICQVNLSDPLVLDHLKRSFALDEYCKLSLV